MKEKQTFYITTAIDYANGQPHMGHALEKIGGDAMARYRRRKGQDVHYVIGMDEHGQKVLQSAEERGISPQAWVDELADQFRAAWERLHIANDDFLRTTEDRHRKAAQEIVRRIQDAGDLYTDTYAGYYCVGCEAYKTEDELEARQAVSEHVATGSGAERAAGLFCPLHPNRELQWMEEENWFFRLSRYQDRLLDLLDERPEFVQPATRRNEVRRVIEGGLDDISVSRGRLPWGVPWPDDPDHVIYVWLEALSNYLSATGFPDEGYVRYWPADYHVIGKDITRFHCIYWPAFLMSAGVELPRIVWAHGFVTYGGRKLSKSEGVTYELDEAIQQHGPDGLRYYVVREVPWDGDGDITRERFDERYTTELANDLGNLVNRSLSMVERYRGGVVPQGGRTSLDRVVEEAVGAYSEAMKRGLLHRGIQASRDLTAAANGFVEERAPWAQAKDPEQAPELDATLASLVRALAALATLLHPVMPGKMSDLVGRLGLDGPPSLDQLTSLEMGGRAIRKGDPLFPRDDLAGR